MAQPAGRGALAALVASYGLAAGAIATLLHTSWADIAVAGAIGVLIGLIAVAGAARPRLAAAGEAIAALVATLLATLLSAFVVPLAIRSVVLAALIVLMPGMTLTTAVRELSSQHLVSGVARMSGALATLLKLTFGAVAATQLCRVLGVQPPLHALAPVPAWTEWPAVLVAAFSFAILFQAARRDWLLVMAAVAISYAAARAGGATFGAPFGVFIGGLLIGGLSNAYARWAHRPGALVREPGIILLVPGSVGFRSVSYLLERDVTLGMDTGLLLLTLLVALVAGLLFGDLVVAPRRSL
uniref:Threonine/serine exporter-like N-terminal domain-containing protein n=1 Tax=Mizugakiibacter sediminis TaxID=1475481 RepID=A0A0U1PAJ8_9GAMM